MKKTVYGFIAAVLVLGVLGVGVVGCDVSADDVSRLVNSGGGGDTPPPPPPANLTSDITFYPTNYASGTGFDPSGWEGDKTAEESWTLTAVEQEIVYFAVTKEAGQTVELADSGDAASVTVTVDGTVTGALSGESTDLDASETRVVFAVDTRNLVFDGGTRTFTLNVSDTDAEKEPKTVTVNLNVEPNAMGAAVFLVTYDNETEILTRKDTGTTAFSWETPTTSDDAPAPFTSFIDALAWVDYNTAINQEWLIRVENEVNEIPRVTLTGPTSADKVVIRLRGMGGTERVIKHDGNDADANRFTGRGKISKTLQDTAKGLIGVHGDSSSVDTPGITLQLERGVTLMGIPKPAVITNHYQCMIALSRKRSVLVMKEGSKITNHYPNTDNATGSIIRLSANTFTGYAIRLEEGAVITGNHLNHSEVKDTPAQFIYKNGGDSPKIFISKNAIIKENGSSEYADKVYYYTGSSYTVSANRTEDLIIFQ
jgi:hypothetical protein